MSHSVQRSHDLEPMSRLVARAFVYRAAERAAPCACGGFVVADPADEHLVELAVQSHQRTFGHLNWRAREGL